MLKKENRLMVAFLVFWSTIVAILFLHTSGKFDIPLLHFTQARGTLLMLHENYKQTNLLGLREEVYAIPHGVPFIHPARKARLQQNRIFVAHSIEEARRMVDTGTENIKPRLVLVEKNFHGYNLYSLGDHIYSVGAMSHAGTPLPTKDPYSEKLVGNNLKEARQSIVNQD